MIYIIKKDETKEEYDVSKVVTAVKKSAARVLYEFSDEEKARVAAFMQGMRKV